MEPAQAATYPAQRGPGLYAIPQPQSAEEAVLLTLSYFDSLGLAVTAFEIWHNLIRYRASYREVLEILSSQGLKKKIVIDRGFYSLRGRALIEKRFAKNKISDRKWRKARRYARWLSIVPFVTSVSVVDSVAYGKAKPKSDIDLFVVTKPGRIWTARIATTGLMHVLGHRRHGKRIKDRACLSFYATDQALDFSALKIEGGDLYLGNWLFVLGTIWQRRTKDQPSLAKRLLEKNEWASILFPQRDLSPLSRRRRVEPFVSVFGRIPQATAEIILKTRLGGWLEQRVRRVQLKYMHKNAPTEIKTNTSHILISDDMLKFHEQDRRHWFRKKTLATYRSLLAKEDISTVAETPELSNVGLIKQSIGQSITAPSNL